MRFIKKILDAIYIGVRYALAAILGFAILLTFFEVIRRYLFGKSFVWSEELMRYLFVYVGFIGGAAAFRDKGLACFDLVTKKISSHTARKVIALVIDDCTSDLCRPEPADASRVCCNTNRILPDGHIRHREHDCHSFQEWWGRGGMTYAAGCWCIPCHIAVGIPFGLCSGLHGTGPSVLDGQSRILQYHSTASVRRYRQHFIDMYSILHRGW